MTNGTLEYYSAVSTLIPLALLTYVFSLRAGERLRRRESLRKYEKRTRMRGWFTRHPRLGLVLDRSFLPLVVVGVLLAEFDCLWVLYRGHPLPGDPQVVLLGFAFVGIGLGAHFTEGIATARTLRKLREQGPAPEDRD